MQIANSKVVRGTPLVVKFGLLAFLLMGLFLLIISSPNRICRASDLYQILPVLGRDFGIALCVSVLVAILIEIYIAVLHQIGTMRDVIDLIMGERITPEVWMELKDLIESKSVIRRNVVLRLELERDSALGPHEAILKVEHQYKLISLRKGRSKYVIAHELDDQFSREVPKLPRWEMAVVKPDEARTTKNSIDTSKSLLEVSVALPPRQDDEDDESVVRVQTRRLEVVTLPGSYNFYSPEFMKGLSMSLVGIPEEFVAEAFVRPHGGARQLPKECDTWSFDPLMFPGQGVEIKFRRRESEP